MSQQNESAHISDNDKLEALINLMYTDLMAEGGRFKIMELLRALEFKRKTAPPDDREGAFWNMIDELRTNELKNSAIPKFEKDNSFTSRQQLPSTPRKKSRKSK